MRATFIEWCVLVVIFGAGQLALGWYRGRELDLVELAVSTGTFAFVYLAMSVMVKKHWAKN